MYSPKVCLRSKVIFLLVIWLMDLFQSETCQKSQTSKQGLLTAISMFFRFLRKVFCEMSARVESGHRSRSTIMHSISSSSRSYLAMYPRKRFSTSPGEDAVFCFLLRQYLVFPEPRFEFSKNETDLTQNIVLPHRCPLRQ